MRILFSDGDLLARGGYLHLVQAGDHWLLVGSGFVSQVHDCEEGMTVVASLRARGKARGVEIDLWRPSGTLIKSSRVSHEQ